jgi:hypothetical protein
MKSDHRCVNEGVEKRGEGRKVCSHNNSFKLKVPRLSFPWHCVEDTLKDDFLRNSQFPGSVEGDIKPPSIQR